MTSMRYRSTADKMSRKYSIRFSSERRCTGQWFVALIVPMLLHSIASAAVPAQMRNKELENV